MPTPKPSETSTVPAWDGPTRLFHWLLVAQVVSAWISVEFASALGDRLILWHRSNGLALLVLLVWRVLWGFAGPERTRFTTFVHGPSAALAHARSLGRSNAPRYLGHNPLGALMIVALLAVLFAQAAFGLFATDDNDLTGGPLHRLVDEAANARATGWHRRIFYYGLVPLVAVHIAANALYGWRKKEPLIAAMITGQKPAGHYADGPDTVPPPTHPWRTAALCLGAAMIIVFGGLLAAGGRLR